MVELQVFIIAHQLIINPNLLVLKRLSPPVCQVYICLNKNETEYGKYLELFSVVGFGLFEVQSFDLEVDV